MNIWDHDYLFESSNTQEENACSYILPGVKFT